MQAPIPHEVHAGTNSKSTPRSPYPRTTPGSLVLADRDAMGVITRGPGRASQPSSRPE
jgi:hypothetical protein